MEGTIMVPVTGQVNYKWLHGTLIVNLNTEKAQWKFLLPTFVQGKGEVIKAHYVSLQALGQDGWECYAVDNSQPSGTIFYMKKYLEIRGER
jgi:hypothetical protein